ncbi:MAG: IS630 family transposase [Planctomycetes bacterium]|nr:IS630 family transposase [Planctomycetota bacterium]
MSGKATPIKLTVEERKTLLSWLRSGTTEQRMSFRAEIILAAAEGKETKQIAAELKTCSSTVSKWRIRFANKGIEGLKDSARSGKPASYTRKTDKRILAVLDQPPPDGYAKWNGPLIAKNLGDVSADYVWRVLRRQGVVRHQRSWRISTDPQFAQKAADIVGLYLSPPGNALVLCVDEKPHVQALERAQGWLRLPNGKAITGGSHEFRRHGTTTLFGALDVATGLAKTGHFGRLRHDFLAFMNEVTALYPDKEIHVILDSLDTHKPKNDRWLAVNKNVHFHCTPTHASWLSQIEIWFNVLTMSALRGASFTSSGQIREAIGRFVEAHNGNAAPFEWTKQEGRSEGVEKHYAELPK